MPSGYHPSARSLSLPVSGPSAASSTPPPRSPGQIRPPWVRSQSNPAPPRSLSPYQPPRDRPLRQQLIHDARRLHKQVLLVVNRLGWWQRAALVFLLLAVAVSGLLFLIFNERIFAWLEPFADKWRNLRAGWLIIWMMTFVSAFPPVVGYSTCLTIAGFLYGMPNGWFVGASATVVGSLCSFLLCRGLLSRYARRLAETDRRFAALAMTLKHDGLKLLVMIRLCPLPYSLSNGAMSTFPTVHPLMYALATAIASPKLIIHIFVGSRLAALAKNGGSMDAGTKAINYASIAGGIIIGVVVGLTIYQRTMTRAAQLESEEIERLRQPLGDEEQGVVFHDDADDGRLGGDLLHGDDISLFETQHNAGAFQDDYDANNDGNSAR